MDYRCVLNILIHPISQCLFELLSINYQYISHFLLIATPFREGGTLSIQTVATAISLKSDKSKELNELYNSIEHTDANQMINVHNTHLELFKLLSRGMKTELHRYYKPPTSYLRA